MILILTSLSPNYRNTLQINLFVLYYLHPKNYKTFFQKDGKWQKMMELELAVAYCRTKK